MMRLLPTTALLATLVLMGCDNDEPPPPGQEDTAAPSLLGTTPAANAEHVSATTDITVHFTEAMKPGVGTVRVTANDVGWPLEAGTWVSQRAFRVRPTEALPEGAQVQVTVETDFEDEAGNRLASPHTFRFTVHREVVSGPYVIHSTPAEGATGVMPVELYKTDTTSTGLRKVIEVAFNEPMDVNTTQVTLLDVTTPSNPPRVLTGRWYEYGTVLSVSIPRPEADLPPLEQENAYALDLTGLRNGAGVALNASHASLGNGRLEFTTGRRNPDVEHACTHALLATPEPVTAGSSPTGVRPATDLGHTFYGLTLPADGASFRGYTEVVSDPDRNQTVALYLSAPVPVAVHDTTEDESAIASTLEPAPPVCASAISHVLKFTAPGGDRFLRLTFGPVTYATFNFVFERY